LLIQVGLFLFPRREHAKEISQIQCFFDTLLT